MNIPKSAFQFIYFFARRQAWGFFTILIASFLWGVNDSFFPYFLKRIVNRVQEYHGAPEGIYTAVSGTLILLFVFWLITEACLRIQGMVSVYTIPRFRANIREAVFDYVKSHSHEYFASHFAGNISKKLADLPASCQTIMEIIYFNFVTASTGVIFVFVLMWLAKPIFACILLFWLCVHLGITIIFLRRGNKLWEAHSDSVSELSGKIVDVFTNMLNVRLFSRGKYEAQYLKKYQSMELKKAHKAMWLIEINRLCLSITGCFFIFGMILTLLYGSAHHWVTLGDFTQIGMQTFWVMGWVWFVSFQLSVFARELGTVSDALSLVTKGHDIVNIPHAPALHVTQGEIQFHNVKFEYKAKQSVFKHLNVVLQSGQKVGLVGFSGSGKSTFVNLILRFYDLKSGNISIDGQDIAKVTQDSLREQIAMIPQDPSLFHRSLMENIRYGRLDATDDEVIHAAKLAHCHEFIDKIDEGYASLVGERGVKLSGGQRQRIAIARAILKNAPILILDEATSSLDTVTEKQIQESLQTLMCNRTTIIVAHRLSTLADMDRILVFHKGEIIEDGDQETLLKAKGHFAMLWNMQTNGFLPEETE
jgi:ATP-binding cassette subfamily B protein